MPDLLLELLSEEIPARMQAQALADLQKLVQDRLAALQLAPNTAQAYVTPRRLTLALFGLPDRQPDRVVELKGPRQGAADAAVQGFLRSAGRSNIDDCELRDTGKGIFYFAVNTVPGQAIESALAAVLTEILDALPWPKSMRWAGHSVRWVRPLQNILALLSWPDGRVVTVPLVWALDRGVQLGATLTANAETAGHRFLAPARFSVTGFADYAEKLQAAKVMLDPAERKSVILAEGQRLAAEQGLVVKPDPALLDEVAGLIEWPVVRLGRIEPRFMALPPEVLTTSMRTHQKYFACQTPDGNVAPFFIVVGNNLTRDGGAQMIAGNERVLRARLSDAEFFWALDRQSSLRSRVPALGQRVFHAKLGSVLDKIRRMQALLPAILPAVPGADPVAAQQAVELAKADLSASLVGEFPELQGVMGRYLALNDGLAPDIALAIARHYAPAGLGDPTPDTPLAIAAALVDKLDTLAGFFAIDEKPTGTRDPYALRRAALGVIRIILDNKLRLQLKPVLRAAITAIPGTLPDRIDAIVDGLLGFFADRLKIVLREQGVRHDLVAAVFALGDEDDLVRLLARVRALQGFLTTEDGANLLTAYRRASKIVQIEEKKDGVKYQAPVESAALELPEEIALAERLGAIGGLSDVLLGQEDFTGAMTGLAGLRQPVDNFFALVTVNVERPTLRVNRLRLLAQIWATLNRVADFSKIEG